MRSSSSGPSAETSSSRRPRRWTWWPISTWPRDIAPVGSVPPNARATAGYSALSSAFSWGSRSSARKRWTRRTSARTSPASSVPRSSATTRQLVELGTQLAMLGAEAPGELRARLVEVAVRLSTGRERTQRVEDHRDVDRFLEQRAPHRWQETQGRDHHRDTRQAHADDHALARDALRARRRSRCRRRAGRAGRPSARRRRPRTTPSIRGRRSPRRRRRSRARARR